MLSRRNQQGLKSHAAAVAFPALILGHNPSAQIICASYGQDLADKHSLDCRTLMTSEWYRSLFPTRLALQKQSVQEFLTTQNGFRLATSVGGVLTGRGADFIISEVTLHGISVLDFRRLRSSAARWEELSIFAGIDHRGSGVSS